MNFAETRGRLAAAWDEAHPSGPDLWPDVVACPRAPGLPEGVSVWRLLDGGGLATVLPSLLSSAPPSVARRYFARVLSNLTGRCPLCSEAAGTAQAASDGSDAQGRLVHSMECPAMFSPEEARRYLDVRAFGAPADRPGFG